MNVQTYLFFPGTCEAAIRLYVDVLGAELVYSMRYKDSPEPRAVPGGEEKILHATLRIGETLLNLSDDLTLSQSAFGGFGLLTHWESIEEAERAFAGLTADGTVKLELQETFWAIRYGIVEDRFGVTWKIQANLSDPRD